MSRPSPDRRSIRLKGYDYGSEGAYFVTICTHRRMEIFGSVMDGVVELFPAGKIAHEKWLRSPTIRQEIELDEFVIMPNHLHGIVFFAKAGTAEGTNVGAHGHAPLRRPAKSLGSFVARYKGRVTTRVRRSLADPGVVDWQRNYYERVIRNERELSAVRSYIQQNSLRWELDRYYSI